MSIHWKNLAIRDRNGERVSVRDCNFEPLNLLLPGAARILVPDARKRRQHAESSSKREHNRRDAGDDEGGYADDEDDADDADTQPLLSKKAKAKGTARHRRDSLVKERALEAKQRKKAEKNLLEAEEEQRRLARRVRKQEEYITILKARYEDEKKSAAAGEKSKKAKEAKLEKKKASSSGTKKGKSSKIQSTESSADEGATTDASTQVRDMLKHMKISAAGSDWVEQPGSTPFSQSEDSQLLVMKKNGESWAAIATAMNRGKSELKRRFKYLESIGAKVPGEDDTDDGSGKGDAGVVSSDVATAGGDTTTDAETTDAEKTGEETTDADNTDGEKTGEETTDAEKTDDEKKDDGFLGEVPFGTNLFALDTTAEELPKTGEASIEKSPTKSAAEPEGNCNGKSKSKSKSKKKSPAPNTQKTKSLLKAPAAAPAIPGGDSGYDASASEAVDDAAGARAYIGRYGEQLIADAYAGRVAIPEADDYFDEDDCVLLALTERSRRDNRWLAVQADFANLTGRLVPEDVLKWKLGEGERPESY